MRDSLPPAGSYRYRECGIINLDSSRGEGTHWVAYKKHNRDVTYFDSFGHLPPPVELLHYLRGCNVKYNFESYQTFNSFVCGHLCILFLLNILKIKQYVFYTNS